MRGRLGARSAPKGGFGNRVLTYLSIRHIARAVDARYFFSNPADKGLVSGIHRPNRIPRRFVPEKVFKATDTYHEGFLPEIREWVSRGNTVSLRGPLLGEVLVRFAKTDSRELTRLTVSQCREHQQGLVGKRQITVHLRAGDFRQWDPEAILPADYYLSALESLGSLPPDEWQVRICVDDSTHSALEVLRDYLKSKDLLAPDLVCHNPFHCDLAAMAQSQILISSPSTFALVAGMLGSSRAIHSARWVENRVNRGERFWEEIGQGTFPGYALERLV